MIVKLFHRLARHADTPNKFNKLRISIENRITPLELDELIADAGPYEAPDEDDEGAAKARRLPPTTQADWCARMAKFNAASGKPGPEKFKRSRAHRNIWFYSSGGDKKSKVLCLCFNSGARRMMMPTPVFLQHLDASLVDVYLFTDADRDGFRRCFDNDDNSVEKQILDLVNLKDYRGVVTIGTSSGGLPAVLVALGLGLDAALSVGGNDPHDLRWITPDGDDGAALVKRYADRLNGKVPDVYLLYADDYDLDANSGKSLAALIPARQIAYYVEKKSKPIGHGVLQPILFRDRLCSLFNDTVLSKFGPTRTGVTEDWSKFDPTAG